MRPLKEESDFTLFRFPLPVSFTAELLSPVSLLHQSLAGVIAAERGGIKNSLQLINLWMLWVNHIAPVSTINKK